MTKSDCKFHVWQISSWSLNSQNSLFNIISRRNWRMISDKVNDENDYYDKFVMKMMNIMMILSLNVFTAL